MDRFNGSFQSERANLKISQLERKWKQILEEERRSCIRNKKLLEDFDHIKQQSRVFSKKSDRLKQAKHNFELYVKSVYPRWTEELKKLQELKKTRASKDRIPPSTDIKDDRKARNRSEISGYVADSENVPLNPTCSSTPYRNGVSFTEPERLTHSVGLEDGNPMPKYSGYDQRYSNSYQQYPFDSNQQYPSNSNQQHPSNSNQQYPNSNHQHPFNSNQQYPFNGEYPRGHPMSNLSNTRSWVHPEALPSGRFPYSGNVSLPRARHAMPNTNHSTYGGQARYGFNSDRGRYLEMGNVPPGPSQRFQDYQGDPFFSGNYNENSAEARAFEHPHQRDHDSYIDGINQVPPRHMPYGQKHDDADTTPHRNDSKSTYRKAESSDENDEQPETRNVSENYADPGNHKTIQGKMVEERVERDGDINCSTDVKDDVGSHEKRRVVGEIGNTSDPEIKVVKERNPEVSDVSLNVDNARKNDENSGSSPIQQVNPATNQELIDINQDRKKENDKENSVNSDSSLSINQGHNEHSVKEHLSKDSRNEIPESDVDSTPSNSPKGQGSQNIHQDSSSQPTDSAQVNQITNPDQSPEREVPREEETKTSIMDDLIGDDVMSTFEISGSEISEDVPSEHEFVTGYNKEDIQTSENITENCGTIPEMKDLKVQDNEAISILPNDNSALNEHSDSKEVSIDIGDAETVTNTGIEMYLQDKREQSSEPKEIEEINETQERDFQIDSKDESDDSQGKEELSHDLDHLTKKQDEEQRSDEENSGVLEDLSFTSEDSCSKSISLKKTSDREKSKKKNETRESMSYSEDFEDEKSILLTETDAYQKMLSSVKVSDEEEDIEEDLLAGSTVSEANIIGQTKQDHNTQQLPKQHSESSSISKKPAVSKSKPKLSVFSSGEGDDLENSFGKDSEGILTSSWKSSEMSLSPPLSPDMDLGGYVPTVVGDKKVDGKEMKKRGADGKDEKEQGKVKQEIGKDKQESKTKSRIQAGFWNHSDTESEIDLQVNPDEDNDDDDFDFYS